VKFMLSLAVLSIAFCTIGCQNDERHDADSATAGRYSGTTSSTITGSSQESTANTDIYGTKNHSGTLSSSSTSDPNTRTMGGGQ
jgi:hypothetical protein